MMKDKFIVKKKPKDTYTVEELLLKPRQFFFVPTGKNNVYYKMQNGEYGFFCKNVTQIEFVNANIKMEITKDGMYIGPCLGVSIDVTIQGNKLYVR